MNIDERKMQQSYEDIAEYVAAINRRPTKQGDRRTEAATVAIALGVALAREVGVDPRSLFEPALATFTDATKSRAFMEELHQYAFAHAAQERAGVEQREGANALVTFAKGAIQVTLPPSVGVERVTTVERDAQRLIQRTRTRDERL